MGEFVVKDFNLYLDSYLNSGNRTYSPFFNELKQKYKSENYALCLNHVLLNFSDASLLEAVLKEINNIRHEVNLSSLIDFILISNNSDSFSNLKVLAIKIIGAYKSRLALEPLLFCLNDKNSNYKIRLASAVALGKIGDKAAYDSLINVAADEKEKSVYVRESAVVALGELGDNRALDVFNSIINSSQMFLDKFSYFKERIVEAIAKLDNTNEKKALYILKTSILDKSPHLRISSIETLMNLNLKESYDLIYDRLINDDDFEVKKNALCALVNISDEKILHEVINGTFSLELKSFAKETLKDLESEADD